MVELLTVTFIICLLAGVLLPAFSAGINRAKVASCGNNMKNIGIAVIAYCQNNSGIIPNITQGLEQASIPLLRLPDGSAVALGRLLDDYAATPRIFGCPDSPGYQEDQIAGSWQQDAMVWSAYLYRSRNNGFQALLNAPENQPKAYVMDFACITNQGQQFAPHKYQVSNLLFTDCHVETRRNNARPFALYTAQASRHGEITPDCTLLWQHADDE